MSHSLVFQVKRQKNLPEQMVQFHNTNDFVLFFCYCFFLQRTTVFFLFFGPFPPFWVFLSHVNSHKH